MTERISSVRIDRVTKVFGPVRAIADVSLEIGPGEVAAVMGANGAGKSTLLSVLSLRTRPTRGEVLFNGIFAGSDFFGRIGLLTHQPLVYPDLTGRENLELFARMYGVDDPARSAGSVGEEMGIDDKVLNRSCRILSRGQLQRVSLARALISKPDLLLLDEPHAGMDSEAISRIEKILEDLKKRGGMAVMVTHEPENAARGATRAVMMRAGMVISDSESPSDADGWKKLYVDTVKGGRG
jgi:heme exporter protein A